MFLTENSSFIEYYQTGHNKTGMFWICVFQCKHQLSYIYLSCLKKFMLLMRPYFSQLKPKILTLKKKWLTWNVIYWWSLFWCYTYVFVIMLLFLGSLSDPGNISGLAHFCEHMLFLGTEKYPKENEYSQYLSEHAGSSNAFTSGEHTNYYFDVSHEHLEGALDRYPPFFLM